MSNQNQNDNGIIKEKLKKVAELKEIGIEPYGRKYEKVNDIAEINQVLSVPLFRPYRLIL